MTPDQIVGATIGALIVIGGGTVGVYTFFKKIGLGKCPDVCPEPQCQGLVQEARDNARDAKAAVIKSRESIISIQGRLNNVGQILEQKRVKIEGLQTDTTEIKTDVKWIVRELRRRNDT
ncbi:MAG: hypothetical protein ACYS8I_09220 [Planctomycetota bacterium]